MKGTRLRRVPAVVSTLSVVRGAAASTANNHPGQEHSAKRRTAGSWLVLEAVLLAASLSPAAAETGPIPPPATAIELTLSTAPSCQGLEGTPRREPEGSAEAYEILTYFYDYSRSIPLEGRVVELAENDTSVRRKVVYRGARGFLVPAYLEIPKGGPSPHPVILLLHGWSGSKESWWEDDNYISGGNARKALLAAGYAVFAIDAQGHGDRIAENDYQVVNLSQEPNAPPRENYFTLRDVVVQTAVDWRRGIDYLETRPDIDARRLGSLGYSMGGFHAFVLTAMEPRLKASVACVVPVAWRPDRVLDPASYVRGFGKIPFMMIGGTTDELCNEAQARELYALIEGPHTALVFFDSGHQLPSAYVEPAVACLRQHLPVDSDP